MTEYTPLPTDQPQAHELGSPLLGDGQTTEEAPQEGAQEVDENAFADGPKPAWFTGLLNVRNDSIDEMHIHVVPWDSVATECVLNAATIFCMLSYLALAGGNPILQALQFSLIFVVVVIAFELSVLLPRYCKVAYVVMMLGLGALLAYLQHPTGPLDLLAKTPMILVTCLCVCSMMIIVCGMQSLQSQSGLYCALTGKKKIKLDGKLELAKLLKSLRVMGQEEESQIGWLGLKRKPKKPLTIGMIKAPEDNDMPDANLELQGEMLPDSDYWLVDFVGLRGFGNVEDNEASQKLLEWLREVAAKNQIAKNLPSYLEPVSNPDDRSLITSMLFENGLTEEPFQNVTVVVQRVDPMQGVWDHWAPRALFVSLLVTLLSLPAQYFLKEVVNMHQDLCANPTEAIKMPGGEVFCKDKTDCAHICDDPMKYIDAVTSSVHTSKAEALFVFILLPVYIFMASVLIVREQHMSFELRYLKGMNRSRAAIQEVLAFKWHFESIRSISEICKRFLRRFTAWSPMSTGDPDLSAFQSFRAELEAVKEKNDVQNRVFEQVSKKMMSFASKQESAHGEYLWNGLYKNPDLNITEPEKQWQEIIKTKDLEVTDRNFSISWLVVCNSKETWELWLAWLQSEASLSMIDCMVQSQAAQDGLSYEKGKRCYLEENLRVGNQLIPKGFSLSHIYCFSPEDGKEFVIELRKGSAASVFEDMDEGMDEEMQKTMRVMQVMDQVSGMVEMLAQNGVEAGDGPGTIFLRFTVSEQFWSTLGSDPGLSKLKGKKMSDFITNLIKEKDCPTFSDVDDENELTYSLMAVVLGEKNPMDSVISIVKVLLKRLMVMILAFLFTLIMPCFRVYIKGGYLFPEPFAMYLIGNAVCCAMILWYFLSMFQLTSERLSLVSSSLAEFELKTLDPSGKATKQGSNDKKSKKDSEGVSQTSPFDLTVNDSGHKYQPTGESEDAVYFQQQWQEKQNNVQNWHYCIGYIRVVVSSSRLTAQAILVAAGLILAFLLLMSFLDAMAGKNGAEAAQFAHSAMDQVKHKAGEMVEQAKAQAKEVVDQTIQDIQGTRRLSLNLGMAAGLINVTSGSIEFTNATEALQELAQPVRHALSFSIGRRLAGQAEASDDELAAKALQDVEKIQKKMLKAFDLAKTITETQFVTIAMVLLVLLYSVPLIYYIALINDSMDRHDSLLLVQKETHRVNMANRQASLSATAAAEPNPDGAADSSAADPSGKVSDKDVGAKRYEKMLDMAIESAQTSKARFPVKLFGFLINMALLTTWITLALSPLAKQVQGMAPGLTMAACQWVEHLDIIEQAEDLANQGVKKANEGISKVNEGIDTVNNGIQSGLDKINEITSSLKGESASPEEMEKFKKVQTLKLFNFQKLFHSYVCKPITKMAAEQAAQAMSSFNEAQTRRLRSIEPLAPAVESWWHAHPGDPHVKLVSVLSILDELERSAMEVSSAIRGDSGQIVPYEAWKPQLEPSLLPNGGLDDFQASGKLHGVPHSIMSALEAERVHNVDELAQLSAEEVDYLSREHTLGDRARFKLFVKVAQQASSKKFKEL